MKTVIVKLRQKINTKTEIVRGMELDLQFKRGYSLALREVVEELEENDLQYDEVERDRNWFLTDDQYQAAVDAIKFIEELVEAWDRSSSLVIHRQLEWERGPPSLSAYQVARGIISRAKGAHDDGKHGGDAAINTDHID